MPKTRSVFVVLRMSQQLTASCINKLKKIVNNLQELSDQTVTEILLYDSPNLKGNQNSHILKCTIKFIMDSKRFTSSLF